MANKSLDNGKAALLLFVQMKFPSVVFDNNNEHPRFSYFTKFEF